jgi:hypothetical protein
MAVVPDEGEQWAVDKVQDVAPNSNAKMDVLAVGTGATAESESVTMASLTEVSEARVSGTLSQPAADTDRLVATMTFAGSKTATQAARTNTTTKGGAGEKMYFYALYTGIPVQSGDSIQYTLDVQYT